LNKNFPHVKVYTNGLGAKHLPPDYKQIKRHKKEFGDLFFIVSTRNPYSWLYGVLAGVREGKLGQRGMFGADFEYKSLDDPKLHIHMLHRYNACHEAWWELLEKEPGTYIQHEEMLEYPRMCLRDLADMCDLAFPEPFQDERREVYPGERVEKNLFTRKQFYLKGKYFDLMPDKMIDLITAEIDWELMNRFGYWPKER